MCVASAYLSSRMLTRAFHLFESRFQISSRRSISATVIGRACKRSILRLIVCLATCLLTSKESIDLFGAVLMYLLRPPVRR